ncbi:hypothetical protein B5E53_09720 [Eubacterium sp. An11]|nr:hypothetical protein B5E53_09720 [Eubacterium sp. An11]
MINPFPFCRRRDFFYERIPLFKRNSIAYNWDKSSQTIYEKKFQEAAARQENPGGRFLLQKGRGVRPVAPVRPRKKNGVFGGFAANGLFRFEQEGR